MMGLCVRSSCLYSMRHKVAKPNRRNIVVCLATLLVSNRRASRWFLRLCSLTVMVSLTPTCEVFTLHFHPVIVLRITRCDFQDLEQRRLGREVLFSAAL